LSKGINMTAFIKTLAAATLLTGFATALSAQDLIEEGEFEGETYTGSIAADDLIGNDVWEEDGTYIGKIVAVNEGADGLANTFLVLNAEGEELEIDVATATRTSVEPVLDADAAEKFK